MPSMASRPKKSPSSKKPRAAVRKPCGLAKGPPPSRRRKPRPAWTRELLAALRPGIERATHLMPWLIADSVLGEAARFLDTDLPPEWADWLDARAERVFARRGQFHRLISSNASGGNAGRDQLYNFMRHWLASRLARERPELYRRLPWSYSLGRPLEHDRRGRRLPRV